MTLLDIIISPAFAEGAGQAQQGNVLLNLLPLILLFVVFYFLLIRPQQKKAKEHKKMVSELKVGDEIITQGGILGKVTETDEVFLQIEIATNVIITTQRNAVGTLMPKGTFKNHTKSEAQKESSSKPKSRSRNTKKTTKTKEVETK